MATGKWYYSKNGQKFGPMSSAELKQLAADGKISPTDLVWKQDWPERKSASTIKGLLGSSTGGPPPRPAAIPLPPPLPQRTRTDPSQPTDYLDRFRSWFLQLGVGGKAGVVAGGIFMSFFFCCPLLGLVLNVEGDPSESGQSAVTTNADSTSDGELTLGDEFQLGDFKYRIQSAIQRNMVGNQFMSERASDGAIFVIVSYVIENCTKETQTVLADDMQLVDSEGRTFSPSSNANTALLAEDGKDFLFSELQPGIARIMQTAFEMPLSSLNGGITLIVPEKGMFSSGEARVRIK